MNSLADLLKGFKPHEPALPSPKQTPKPQRSKVNCNPVRVPVNRQAEFIIAPNRDWSTQPLPPEKLPDKRQDEIDELKAQIKIERNEHAQTRDALGQTRKVLQQERAEMRRLHESYKKLEHDLNAALETIKQLEDIKL